MLQRISSNITKPFPQRGQMLTSTLSSPTRLQGLLGSKSRESEARTTNLKTIEIGAPHCVERATRIVVRLPAHVPIARSTACTATTAPYLTAGMGRTTRSGDRHEERYPQRSIEGGAVCTIEWSLLKRSCLPPIQFVSQMIHVEIKMDVSRRERSGCSQLRGKGQRLLTSLHHSLSSKSNNLTCPMCSQVLISRKGPMSPACGLSGCSAIFKTSMSSRSCFFPK
jgi:hypothetical protein